MGKVKQTAALAPVQPESPPTQPTASMGRLRIYHKYPGLAAL